MMSEPGSARRPRGVAEIVLGGIAPRVRESRVNVFRVDASGRPRVARVRIGRTCAEVDAGGDGTVLAL